MSQKLGSFEGKQEVSARVQIAGVNDSLTTPLSALPRAWKSGERLPILVWVKVETLRHDPAKEGSGCVRVHLTEAYEAAVLDHIDEALLNDLLSTQREAVAAYEADQERLRDEAKGIHKLPLDQAERPDGMSDQEWEESAAALATTAQGTAKKSRKPRAPKDPES